jgi:hypothetical protein
MGRQHQQGGTVCENQQTERDRHTLKRTVLKNYTTTAAQVNCGRTEYSS